MSASSNVWLSILLNCFSTVTMSRHTLEDIMGQGIFPIDGMDEATLCGRGRESSSMQLSCAVLLDLGGRERSLAREIYWYRCGICVCFGILKKYCKSTASTASAE